MGGAALAAVAVAAGGWLWARSFRAFTEQRLVAVVRCERPAAGSPHSFLLKVRWVEGEGAGDWQSFPMQGDQWMIGGDLLKWHPLLSRLGLKNRHKLTRLNSRYWDAPDERSRPRSVYELNGGTDPLWRWLYQAGEWIPGVETVYGNAAYTPAIAGATWGVYVGLTGYLIKRLPPAPSPPAQRPDGL